jgi:hypothetical protein
LDLWTLDNIVGVMLLELVAGMLVVPWLRMLVAADNEDLVILGSIAVLLV